MNSQTGKEIVAFAQKSISGLIELAIIHCHWQLGSSMLPLSEINLLALLNVVLWYFICLHLCYSTPRVKRKGGIF
jgi:hypothetical protein